jgi:hypothetical protein
MVSGFENYKKTISHEGSGERAEAEKGKMIEGTKNKIQALGEKNNEYGDNDEKIKKHHELLRRLKEL